MIIDNNPKFEIHLLPQCLRQRKRTNLLTARQTLNLMLVVIIQLMNATAINAVYSTVHRPDIMYVTGILLD